MESRWHRQTWRHLRDNAGLLVRFAVYPVSCAGCVVLFQRVGVSEPFWSLALGIGSGISIALLGELIVAFFALSAHLSPKREQREKSSEHEPGGMNFTCDKCNGSGLVPKDAAYAAMRDAARAARQAGPIGATHPSNPMGTIDA
jgi:hypothetical protein